VVVICVVACAVVVGCKSSEPAKPSAAGVIVNPLKPPSGYVMSVKPNGECVIDMGTRVGVADGDWLLVKRKGETVQYLAVVNAKADVSYCRVAMSEEPIRVKVDDRVILEPKGLKDMHRPAGQ
jgi:hypothetical protein